MAEPTRPNAAPVPAGPPGYRIPPPQTGPAPAAPSAAAPSSAAPSSAAPSSAAPSRAATPPAAPTGTATTSGGAPLREPVLIGGLTQNGAILGAAAMLALAVVFFVLRGAVRSHLIANRATLSSANGASWALFTFLFVAAFTVVFGLIGDFWTLASFVVPLGVLSLVTLVLFVVLFNSATRIGR
jgi:hypothetical protein